MVAVLRRHANGWPGQVLAIGTGFLFGGFLGQGLGPHECLVGAVVLATGWWASHQPQGPR